MLAAPPLRQPSDRSVIAVLTVAALLVGGAVGAQFAPQRMPAPPAHIDYTPPPVVPHFAEPPPPPPPVPVMSECDLYVARIRELAFCEKLPKDARDAILQSVDQMETSFRDMTPEVREQTTEGCRQANTAIDQAAESMGCSLSYASLSR
jgi:hypothetical protein